MASTTAYPLYPSHYYAQQQQMQLHPALDPAAAHFAYGSTRVADMPPPPPTWELKTIALIEVAAPPPMRTRSPHSVVTTSSGYSSTTSASSSSASSADPDHAERASSFCSSDEDDDAMDCAGDADDWCADAGPTPPVLAWRASFSQAARPDIGAPVCPLFPPRS
jgi:hypothetical protein